MSIANEYIFNRSGDYRQQLDDVIQTLFKTMWRDARLIPQQERAFISNEVIEAYYAQTHEVPKSAHLSLLAAYILKEDRLGAEWKDASEYPALSPRQIISRQSREASMIHLENCDDNRIVRNPATRTARIQRELRTKKVK